MVKLLRISYCLGLLNIDDMLHEDYLEQIAEINAEEPPEEEEDEEELEDDAYERLKGTLIEKYEEQIGPISALQVQSILHDL